jgi:hypothetical protein
LADQTLANLVFPTVGVEDGFNRRLVKHYVVVKRSQLQGLEDIRVGKQDEGNETDSPITTTWTSRDE